MFKTLQKGDSVRLCSSCYSDIVGCDTRAVYFIKSLTCRGSFGCSQAAEATDVVVCLSM